MPTIASTDAPCSALSVIYTDEGVFSEYLLLPKNPDLVLVDTDIVSKAPARLLVAGIDDALATYFEARACLRANALNMAGGNITKAAHAIHNGFTVLSQCHHLYHGEKVAFGTIVQLVLENSSMEEIEEVIGLCLDLDIPVTLEDMGIKEVKKEEIREVAKASCAEGETIHNMPYKVTEDDVYAAIMAADAVGRLFK